MKKAMNNGMTIGGCQRVAAAAAILAAAGAAGASVYGYYNTDSNQLWGVTYMPDFDQKRAAIFNVPGLPGDGGMYCVPTATMNVLAYLDAHGSPQIQFDSIPYVPGDANAYASVTNELELLGFLMETDPSGGTGVGGWYVGTDLYLPSDGFVVFQQLMTANQNTTSREIAKVSRQGGLPALCYGRWNSPDGIVLTSRDTGHCVTPTRIEHGGGVSELRFRNPSSSDSEFFQSDYVHQSITIQDSWFSWNGQNYLMTQMMFAPSASDTRLRLIDSIQWIFPQQGLTNWPQGSLTVNTPNPIIPTQPSVKTYACPSDPTHFEMSPDRTFIAYTTTDPTTGLSHLWRLDTQTEQSTQIARLTSPAGLAFGRDGNLFVGDGSSLKKFPVVGGQIGAEETSRTPNGETIKDIAYDDETDMVFAICNGVTVLAWARVDGSAVPQEIPLPSSLDPASIKGIMPLPGDPYGGSSGVDARDYAVWRDNLGTSAVALWTDDRFIVLGADPATGDVVPTEELALNFEEIKFASMDQHGKLYLVAQNPTAGGPHVRVFNGLGTAAGLQEDPASSFANLPTGGAFKIGRSRTNYQAALHSGPGWNTNTPTDELLASTEIPDCPADWNVDDTVDVFDLLAYLDDWFAGAAAADLTGDTTTDVFDLLAYLDLWFAGC